MRKKIYFASDFHLGIDGQHDSRTRERQIIQWLESISSEAAEIYLLGDIFDFWFEYKTVIPKGFVRLMGKLAELRDASIQIHFFTGNHDMWMFNYFEEEIGIPVHRQPVVKVFDGKKFLIGHGDGLGPGDHGYKFIKKVFNSKICQWLFARIHPNLGIRLARFWSGRSRFSAEIKDRFSHIEEEWLVQYARGFLRNQHIDYFVFGHRHIPIDFLLKSESRYINLGDWLHHNSYAVWDGDQLELKFFENPNGIIYPKD